MHPDAPRDILPFVVFYLAAINALTFVLYGWDKAQARDGGWRVSERTLLVLGFLGGSVGGFAAQRIFHHKTRKASFQWAFWFCVAAQIALVAFVLFTDTGASILARLHVSPSSSS